MSAGTTIEWTDATWNPVVGCSVISPGCTNCYAMRLAARLEAMGSPIYQGLTQDTKAGAVWNATVRVSTEDQILKPLKWKKPRRIFVNSMSDLFHEALPDSAIDTIFAVMALCPQHTFQVLTKRSERMRRYFLPIGGVTRASFIFSAMGRLLNKNTLPYPIWPLPNVWMGVSVEDQQRADQRVPNLLHTPAAVRFLSCEPLLEQIDIAITLHGIDWVICGGESTALKDRRTRALHPAWAKSLRDQCAHAYVPFFFKQWGNWSPEDPGKFCMTDRIGTQTMYLVGKSRAGRWLDGRLHNDFPGRRAA